MSQSFIEKLELLDCGFDNYWWDGIEFNLVKNKKACQFDVVLRDK